jgi:hypothetical protein
MAPFRDGAGGRLQPPPAPARVFFEALAFDEPAAHALVFFEAVSLDEPDPAGSG